MKTTALLRRLAFGRAARRIVALGFVGATFLGCRTTGSTPGTPATAAVQEGAFVPLPPIEREVGPEVDEVVATPAPDAQLGPKTWKQKFADFCTPKPPPKSRSNRVYESDNVPYSD